MNPGQGTVASTRVEVWVDRERTLPGRFWGAANPRALVAITHGLGEHSGRYAALASDLVAAGCCVVAVDFPGHGEARGPRGDIHSWSWLRDCIVNAMWKAPLVLADASERLPRILFGHSMGGLLALDYALAHPRELAGVAVSAPALRSAMPPWWKLVLANVARATTPSLGFPHGLDESGMSRDPEVLRLRAADPLMHDRISPRLYHEMSEARLRVQRDGRRLAVPALLMHGDADRVVFVEGTADFAQAAPRELTTLRTYAGAYHEIFNDPARAEALADLLRWLERVVRRQGP